MPRDETRPTLPASADAASETVDLTPGPAPALPLPQDQGHKPPPERVGRFAVRDKLGEGGMGVVYLARDPALGRDVALKFAPAHADAETLERFMAEAQITAQLSHPGVVPVYGLELDADGTMAYAMKPIHGETLLERIEESRALLAEHGYGSRPWRRQRNELLERFARACEAVHFAHSQGVIHRDLKPENVMLGGHHEVYVLDWGLAKLVGEPDAPRPVRASASPRETQEGAIKGTPLYMAPEQARGDVEELGPAADIYALGLILSELIYLRPARSGGNAAEVLRRAADNRLLPPPAELDRSRELRAIVERACASEPARRYASAVGIARDLRAVLRNQPTEAWPDRGWARLRRWITRHPRLVIVLLAGASLLGGVAAVWSSQQQQVLLARARLEAERSQRALGRLQTLSGDRARQVAIRFLSYGGLTGALAASSAEVLRQDLPTDERPYPAEAFQSPQTAPPGSQPSAHYAGRLVCAEATVGFAPPGPKGARDLALLGQLEARLRACFLGPGAPLADAAEVERRVVAHRTPVEWAYVALERSGAIVTYPGTFGDWSPDYDPRQRPWYREAVQVYREEGRERNWSSPYLDVLGQGVVITCTEVILDARGALLGVAGLDISVGELSASLLDFPQLPGFRRAALLDAGGSELLASDSPQRTDAPLYGDPEVVAGVREKTSGLVERGEAVVAWSVLARLGWAVVVEAERATLFSAQR